jgi:predicted DNA-binding transcriptional regulator YafY
LITAAHHGDPPVGVSEAPHRRNQRLEHILSLLQREDLPARGLLDRLRRARIPCSRRMLQLDLDLLRQRLGPDQLQRITRQQVEHMPRGCAAERIFFRLRTGGVHRVTPTGNLVLGDDELVALHLARRLVRGSGTGIHPLADALDRVLASLGIPTADPQDTPAPWEPVQVSSCGAMPYAAVHLTTLLRAIRNDCALAVSYKRIGAHDVEEFQALPARLVLIDGVWYCASWVPQNNRLRLLAVARIQSADLIATRITRPSDLTSQVDGAIHLAFRGHVDDTSVRIELAVDNFAWDAVAHQTWGARQKTVTNRWPDRPRPHALAFTTRGLDAITPWILQFAGHMEVLAPTRLRRLVASEAQSTANIHQQNTLALTPHSPGEADYQAAVHAILPATETSDAERTPGIPFTYVLRNPPPRRIRGRRPPRAGYIVSGS